MSMFFTFPIFHPPKCMTQNRKICPTRARGGEQIAKRSEHNKNIRDS